MSEDFFQRWVCDDVLGSQMASVPVVTLSTVVYPLPLLVRNPTYASHPLLAASAPSGEGGGGGGGWEGFAGGRQARIEALETLLTRIVLKPSLELRKRARDLAVEVRAGAEKWWRRKGSGGQSPKVVGLHVRTYFVKAVSGDKVIAKRQASFLVYCRSVALRVFGGYGRVLLVSCYRRRERFFCLYGATDGVSYIFFCVWWWSMAVYPCCNNGASLLQFAMRRNRSNPPTFHPAGLSVSNVQVVRNLEHFAECASAGSGDGKDAGDIFYFVATDEAETQALARQVHPRD